jgi:hypothetical protein
MATTNDDVPAWQKACVGVLGGIALSLLKLIDAQFYVNVGSAVVVQAAYLTFAAYMMLGALAAVFFADHDLPQKKIIKNAFVIGLLAPSLLLALVSQPVRISSQAPSTSKAIPQISMLPIASAFAEEPPKAEPSRPYAGTKVPPNGVKDWTASVDFKTVPPSALEPSFADALKGVLGREDLPQKYIYVLGSTPDKMQAIGFAYIVDVMLAQDKLKTSVVQIEGQPKFFVTVGGIGDFNSALKFKSDSTAAITKSLARGDVFDLPSDARNKIAKSFANAPIVKSTALKASE